MDCIGIRIVNHDNAPIVYCYGKSILARRSSFFEDLFASGIVFDHDDCGREMMTMCHSGFDKREIEMTLDFLGDQSLCYTPAYKDCIDLNRLLHVMDWMGCPGKGADKFRFESKVGDCIEKIPWTLAELQRLPPFAQGLAYRRRHRMSIMEQTVEGLLDNQYRAPKNVPVLWDWSMDTPLEDMMVGTAALPCPDCLCRVLAAVLPSSNPLPCLACSPSSWSRCPSSRRCLRSCKTRWPASSPHHTCTLTVSMSPRLGGRWPLLSARCMAACPPPGPRTI